MTTFYLVVDNGSIEVDSNSRAIIYRNLENAKTKAETLSKKARIESTEIPEDSEFDLYYTIGD